MNNVVLVGNLTKDPELRQTNSGLSVCNFTVAVSRNFKNADGEVETDFIPVVAWRTQADNCAKYLKKGRKVAVSGSIQTRSYDAEDGTKRYVTEVMANSVEFLTSKSNSDQEVEAAPEEDDKLPF